LLIFFTGTFKAGDYIQVLPENIEGKVTNIGFIFTSLKEENGNIINISNNLLFQKYIKIIKNK